MLKGYETWKHPKFLFQSRIRPKYYNIAARKCQLDSKTHFCVSLPAYAFLFLLISFYFNQTGYSHRSYMTMTMLMSFWFWLILVQVWLSAFWLPSMDLDKLVSKFPGMYGQGHKSILSMTVSGLLGHENCREYIDNLFSYWILFNANSHKKYEIYTVTPELIKLHKLIYHLNPMSDHLYWKLVCALGQCL